MNNEETLSLEDELEELLAESKDSNRACPVDRKEREACIWCEG